MSTERPIIPTPEELIDKYRYTLNFDGGSRGNPGPSAAGWVIKDRGENIIKGSAYLGDFVTNNEAEYGALIHGLESCFRHKIKDDLLIIGDSKVIIYHVKGIWGCKKPELQDMLKEVSGLLKGNFTNYDLIHRKRRYNKEADKMVNLELRKLTFRNRRQEIDKANSELREEKKVIKVVND